MQVTTGIDAKRPKGTANGLSEVLTQTRKLRLQTRDFERRLVGPTCRTLRALLRQQADELGRAEAELAKRAREIRDAACGSKWPLETSDSATDDGTIQAVDERVIRLAQAHEAVARVVRSARGLAEQVHDVRTSKLLARRTDVHEKAAWTLTSMYLPSLISCELCAARFTCPLSAARPAAMVTAVEKCKRAQRPR